MGNDGGSIPLRSELVKLKNAPKNAAEAASANNEHAWQYCTLSRAPLVEPLASDAFGRLYNKESVIRYVLDREAFGDASKTVPHITSMKDIVELKIAKSDGKFICEVTRRDMNGQFKFIYLVPCGHVFAAEALSAIQSQECLICAKTYAADDVIPLNPAGKDIEQLQRRMDTLRKAGMTHSGAAQKLKKKRKAVDQSTEESAESPTTKKVSHSANKSAAEPLPTGSAVLQSLFTKNNRPVTATDGFLTRGTLSRVG